MKLTKKEAQLKKYLTKQLKEAKRHYRISVRDVRDGGDSDMYETLGYWQGTVDTIERVLIAITDEEYWT